MTTDTIDTRADSGSSSDFTSEALRASDEQVPAHLKQSAGPVMFVPRQACAHDEDARVLAALELRLLRRMQP